VARPKARSIDVANRNRPAFSPPGGHIVTASVHREAVKQASAAGALQPLRAAAARGMRRIPRVRWRIVLQAQAVAVTDDGRAFGAALGPVAASRILVRRWRTAVFRRASEDVVLGADKEPPWNVPPVFRQGILQVDFIVGMQILDIGCDLDTIDIDPRAPADPVAGVHRRRPAGRLRAEIGVPNLGAGADLGCQVLAMLIGTGEAAEVGALGSADAADEECHVGIFGRQRLRLQFPGQNERRKRRDCESNNCKLHEFLPAGCYSISPEN